MIWAKILYYAFGLYMTAAFFYTTWKILKWLGRQMKRLFCRKPKVTRTITRIEDEVDMEDVEYDDGDVRSEDAFEEMNALLQDEEDSYGGI